MGPNFFGGLFVILGSVVFAILLVYAFVGSAWELAVRYTLKRSGRLIDAEITDKFSKSTGRGISYFIDYAFIHEDQDERYTRQQAIYRKYYRQCTTGTPIRVSILPNKPTLSRFLEDDHEQLGAVVAAMIIVVIAGYYLGFVGILFVVIVWASLFGVDLLLLRHSL